MLRKARITSYAFGIALLFTTPAIAQDVPLLLSEDLEIHNIPNVGAGWQTVSIANDLSNPVVACTYTLPSNASNDATIRLRNVSPGSFELRVQRFENSSAFTASTVFCLVAESGAHTLPDGRAFEAGTVLSTVTNGNSAGWTAGQSERIDTLMSTSFSNPVVLGSVMTFNDPNASVFWTWNGSNRGAPPTSNAIWVGKHIGMINGTRANETLSYIVFEEGSGTANGLSYQIDQGPNSVAGTGNNPPYNYTISGDLDMAVATQAAENGGNGGWAVLYGADPLPAGRIQLAVEEETVAGDTTRRHINEEVFYLGVENVSQAEDFDLSKTVIVHPDSDSDFMIPGADVLYTLTVENIGNGVPDRDSLFIYDAIPPELTFVNGDANGAALPGTDPLVVTPGADSGLSVGTIGYSTGTIAPSGIGDCTAGPSDAVTYVCVALDGYAQPGALYSDVAVDVIFRAKVR